MIGAVLWRGLARRFGRFQYRPSLAMDAFNGRLKDVFSPSLRPSSPRICAPLRSRRSSPILPLSFTRPLKPRSDVHSVPPKARHFSVHEVLEPCFPSSIGRPSISTIPIFIPVPILVTRPSPESTLEEILPFGLVRLSTYSILTGYFCVALHSLLPIISPSTKNGPFKVVSAPRV